MGIKLVVAVTDDDWFETLRRTPNLDEVNFWSPSPANFRALQPDEFFLLKLHAPRNAIVGGGIFAHANLMTCSVAWREFGEANGARSCQEMRTRIARYRKADPADRSDFLIGCHIVTQPFFLDEHEWIRPPESWSRNIVSFKTYTAADAEGVALWDAIANRLRATRLSAAAPTTERYGEPCLVRPRLGQGAFRVLVADSYGRRCAVTGERTLPALEAAHIRPFAEGGEHAVRNGLLLRRDIHSVFDSGYVTVTPERHFEVSRRIRDEFENGRHYYALRGKHISAPRERKEQPDPAAPLGIMSIAFAASATLVESFERYCECSYSPTRLAT